MAVVLTLLIAGFVLLTLELVLPGLIAGIAGVVCLGAGVVLAYTRLGTTGGHVTLLITGSILLIGFLLWLNYFPASRLGRRFVSNRAINDIGPTHPGLLHRSGVALTNLRPCGTATIDGRRVDVITEGSMVAPGTPVRVIEVEGLRIVVRPDPEPLIPRPPAAGPGFVPTDTLVSNPIPPRT